MDLINLEGRTILITGANRGIGSATAKLLAKVGANVILTGRDIKSLEYLAESLREFSNEKVMVEEMDVSNTSSIKATFQRIFKANPNIYGLVNNAGVLQDALLGMVTETMVDDVFGVNVKGTIFCTQYAIKLMQRQKSGSIVNISSIIGSNGNVGQVAYSASKSAVIGITKSLAKELASMNIRVNAIAPGFIDTDMARSISEVKFKERLDSIKMNRIGTPEEVAKVILFLLSDMASYVTGQIIGVDGGMLI